MTTKPPRQKRTCARCKFYTKLETKINIELGHCRKLSTPITAVYTTPADYCNKFRYPETKKRHDDDAY